MTDAPSPTLQSRPRLTEPTKLRLEGLGLSLAGLGLVFAGHIVFGAMIPKMALTLSIGAALILVACLIHPGLRRDLSRLNGMDIPALLFLATLAIALWSLTPYTPGGPAPVWAYVGITPGAATVDRSATLLEFIKLLGLACLFVVGAVTAAQDGRARTAYVVLLGLGALFSLWTFGVHVTGHASHGGPRFEARFLAPNTAGTFFAAMTVLSVAPIISSLRSGSRSDRISNLMIYGAGSLTFFVCLLMTASRGGFMAASAGLVVFFLLQVFSGKLALTRAAVLTALTIVGVGVLLAVAGDLLVTRFLSGDLQDSGREPIFAVHLQAFQDAPLLGNGLGSFEAINRSLMTSQNFQALWSVRATHSVYLSWLEQAGLLGSLPMFGLLGLLIWRTLSQTMQRSRMTSQLFALLAVNVVFLVHGASDFALETYSMASFWAYLLGFQVRLSQGSRS